MGISEADLAFIAATSDLRSFRRVCDLGDQDLHCNSDAVFDGMGISAPRRGKSADFWKALGAEHHVSLDLVGEAVRFDLNVDRVPEIWEQFDLVTNCGTTEHLINQGNAFKAVHDLTRSGGIIFLSLPIGGYGSHGLFTYSVKFFSKLAAANRYKVLAARVDVASKNTPHETPEVPELTPLLLSLNAPDAGIRLVMRKMNSAPFVLPMDLPAKPLNAVTGFLERVKRRLQR